MKALSIQQPWASLVALGEKKIETRGWKPRKHPGAIAIHAGLKRPGLTHVAKPEFLRSLIRHDITDRDQLPLGQIIAVATLGDFVRSEDVVGELDDQELAFGHYGEGRWCWLITDVVELKEPVHVGGQLGLWKMEDEVLRKVLQQIAPVAKPGEEMNALH